MNSTQSDSKLENTLPNASILILLTFSENNEEFVFFSYLKEIEEIAPKELHWYPDYGNEGQAIFLWKDKKIKEWVVIGNDSELLGCFNVLIENKELKVNFSQTTIKFIYRTDNLTPKINNDLYNIEGIPQLDDYLIKYSSPDLLKFVIFSDEENICKYIEGYKPNIEISPMFPPGILHEGFLFENFQDNIFAVYHKRTIYCDFKGDKKTAVNKEPIKLKGFLQTSKKNKKILQIIIRDFSGEKELGKSQINIDSGRWEVNLSEPIGKGQIILADNESGERLYGKNFIFIKDIKFNSEIINTEFTDLYNRKIWLKGKKEFLNPIEQPIIWLEEIHPSGSLAEIELCDSITKVLISLGENIIINDPFFFGDINEINSQLNLPSKGQFIFINALLIAILKSQVESIDVIGNWHRAKKYCNGDKQYLKEKYKYLTKSIFSSFLGKSSNFKLKEFNLIFSDQPFHDRYWMGNNIKKELVYNVSNSISGLFESKELRIELLKEKESIKIIQRINERKDKGDKINLI